MYINNNHIKTIIIGIRYKKAFKISDFMGHIFDIVLRDKSSPFDEAFFPKYKELSIHNKILLNDTNGNFLHITTTDILFSYTINEEKFIEEFNWIKNHALPFIIDKIFIENKIINIERIGVVFNHIINESNWGNNIINLILKNQEDKYDQFNLTFGNKETTIEGLTKSGINDYINNIILLKQLNENDFSIVLDHQYYFNPELIDLKQWKYTEFIDHSINYLNNKFYPKIMNIIPELVGAK